jgi:membrane protein required for colicin V production
MNWVDWLIIALLLFSAVAGLMRGLLREIISLLTWVLAIALAWRYSDLLEPHLGGALAGTAIRPWAARIVIFAVILLVGTAVGALLNHFVRLSLFSTLDRALGLLFGMARGAVAIGLLTIGCQALHLDREAWYRGSQLVPTAERVGSILRVVAGNRAERTLVWRAAGATDSSEV